MWKKYITAESLIVALEYKNKFNLNSKIISGGTDLFLELKHGISKPVNAIIDISKIKELKKIYLDENGVIHIGPNVTHNDCVSSDIIKNFAPCLSMACWEVGSPQIRNCGTIAGNIITASPANDTIPPLLALNAKLLLKSNEGERVIPIIEFYRGVKDTVIKPNEILVDIFFDGLKENQKSIFLKYAIRKSQAISICNMAIVLTLSNSVVQKASITLGSVAPIVIHATTSEKYIIGKEINKKIINETADLSVKEISPINDIRGSADFRKEAVIMLVKRGLNLLSNSEKYWPIPDRPILLSDKDKLDTTIKGTFIHDESNKTIQTTINGKKYCIKSGFNKSLLHFIREDVGLTGSKEGCSEGECGACTILLNGSAVMSCILPAPKAQDAEIITIEGLSRDNELSHIQEAFINSSALQCGYCTPGFLMSATKLLDEESNPTENQIQTAFSGNLCRCTGYINIIKAVNEACKNSKKKPINIAEIQDVNQITSTQIKKDAINKVKGITQYSGDKYFSEMLVGKILWSKYPHAEIMNINTSEAEKIKGVYKVITAKDIPGKNQKGYIIRDEPAIAFDKVRHIGDPIAAVFADTIEIAQIAIEKIKVEYKELPIIHTPFEAAQKNAVLIHEKGNLCHQARIIRGDVEEAFTKCDEIVENTYTTQRIDHSFLEPESGIAYINSKNKLVVEVGTQGVFETRTQLSEILNIEEEDIEVIQAPQGGCFGGKLDMIIEQFLAIGAYITRRPVKIVLSREESLRSHVKRHPAWMHYKLGADKNGHLLALNAEITADTGAYTSLAMDVLENMVVFGAGPYYIPNLYIDGKTWFTNNVYCGSMRGFGVTQVAVAVEQSMDELARKLNIDPLEFRLLNALDVGLPTAANHILENGVVSIKETILGAQKALKNISIPKSSKNKRIGVGVASAVKNVGFGHGIPEEAGTIVNLNKDGNVTIKVTHHEYGQGAHAAQAQLASSELCIPLNKITVVGPDTDETISTHSTTASSQTFLTGNSTIGACKKLKEELFTKAAEIIESNPKNLKFYGNKIIDTELNKELYLSEIGAQFEVDYIYKAPKTIGLIEVEDQGKNEQNESCSRPTHWAYSYNTQVAVIEVDIETGSIKVLKVISVNDVGKAINPKVIEGQVHGGVMQGIGYALCEEYQINNGQNLTNSFSKYIIPTIDFVPEIIPIIIEVPHPNGPYGAKGFAEAPSMATAPAVLNAIYDAIGIRITKLPANKESILKALKNNTGIN